MLKCTLLTLLLPMTAIAEQLVLFSPEGKQFILDVSDEMTVSELSLGICPGWMFSFEKSTSNSPRDYLKPVSGEEKNDIAYIVNTMGMSSLAKIAKAKSSLKSAGARIDHIHPLRFLGTVFADDKMKASMRSLYKRSWVWDEFFDGIKDSLNEETDRGTMKAEYVLDFTTNLNLSYEEVQGFILQRKWESLIRTLIYTIPRNHDVNRYDM